MLLVSVFVDPFAFGNGQEIVSSGPRRFDVEKIGAFSGRNSFRENLIPILAGSRVLAIIVAVIICVIVPVYVVVLR